MDIVPPKNPQLSSQLIFNKIDSLSLKLNQQLEVKVLSTQVETLNLVLKSIASSQPIQVKSNFPVTTSPEQTFQLIVSKLMPVAEFKVLGTVPEINFSNAYKLKNPNQVFNLKDLVFKQTIPSVINPVNKPLLQNLNPLIVSAKVLDITRSQIKLQLPPNSFFTSPVSEKNQVKLPLQLPPIITLNKNQFNYSAKAFNQLPDSKPIPVDLQRLVKGQQIKLEVVTSSNQPEFKLLSVENNAEQKIRETFKKLLPVQQQPEVLLNQIIKNLKVISKNQTIPETLKQLAREILQTLPLSKNLQNPAELKKYIGGSGLFLESKITQLVEKSEENIKQDLKNQLLKFNYGLKQAVSLVTSDKNQEQKEIANDLNLIKDLQQKTESSLAKIILNQLSSLPKDEGIRQVWILDLPFVHKEIADSVSIEINRQQHNEEDSKPENWSVSITVTPPGMDTIHCNISCFDKTINTRFWSDTEAVVSTINNQLDYLKTQFEKVGIIPGHMSVQTGKPRTNKPNSTIDQSLFDQKA